MVLEFEEVHNYVITCVILVYGDETAAFIFILVRAVHDLRFDDAA